MGSMMKKIGTQYGVDIYRAANTHPRCTTTSLAVFIGEPKKIIRFRYNPSDVYGFSGAYNAASDYIKKHINGTQWPTVPGYSQMALRLK